MVRERVSIQERDFVQSLARGLAVIRAFDSGSSSYSLAEIASAAGVSRPAARRLLLTLQELGYVRFEQGRFSLAPRILTLGQAFLSSATLVEAAQPYLKGLASSTAESAALATLDGVDVVFLARVAADRIVRSVLVVGSRLPAYASSLGRVLLAAEDAGTRRALLHASDLRKLTPHTETRIEQLLLLLEQVNEQGWSIVDQEVEEGLRTVAVPVRDHRGAVVAALGSSGVASRVSLDALERDVLPLLKKTAAQISERMGYEGH